MGDNSWNGNERNRLLVNQGGLEDGGHAGFVEAAAPYGLDSLGDGRGLGISDFDGDGDQDLVINNYLSKAQYFVNQVADGHWLQVRLRGRESNRDGVGAILRIETGDGKQSGSRRQMRRQMRVVTAGDGYASQYSRVAHFGLGDDAVIDRLEVTWPLGKVQEFRDVEADRLIEVDEASDVVRFVRGPRPAPRLERVDPPRVVCKTPVDQPGADGEGGAP